MILAQSGLWMAAVGFVIITGLVRSWGDAEYLVFSLAVAAPAVFIPAFSRTRPDRGRPWRQCYWFKLNVWVAVVVAFGTYFGTHYFFDFMGMRYAFGAKWTFDAAGLGHSGQHVPVFMYPLTHAYFMTYYAVLMVGERAVVRRLRPGMLGRALVVLALAYAIAFAETFCMASDLLGDLFAYEKRGTMLAIGSFGYAVYFVIGLPMVRRIDADGTSWTLGRVVLEALATCMAILVLLEVWAKLMGPL